MTVRQENNMITLTGTCGVEEVETLVGFLESQPQLRVDLTAAVSIHTALWQAMMVFRPEIIGLSASSLAEDKVAQGLSAYLAQNPNLSV